jgi:hypothetical protein
MEAAIADPPRTKAREEELEGEGQGENGNGGDGKPVAPSLELEPPQKQMTLLAGGKAPETSTAKMRNRKITVPKGEFEKGETVDVVVKCRVDEVHFIDKHDGQTGEIVEVERRHILRPVGLEKV